MQTGLKLLRTAEVCARVGYSRVHIQRLEKAGKFVKRVHVGENRIGWFEHEIDAWLLERAALRDAPAAQGTRHGDEIRRRLTKPAALPIISVPEQRRAA